MENRLWSMAILLMVLSRLTVAAPSCSPVGGIVAPCLSFLKGEEDPSNACWAGVKNMQNITEIQADRIAISNSRKQSLVKLKVSDEKRLPLLREKCGVDYNIVSVDKSTYYNNLCGLGKMGPCVCMCPCVAK